MTHSLRSRLAGRSLLALALAATVAGLRGQTTVVELDAYVVSASRTPQDPKRMPNAVTALRLADLQAAQVPDLATALSSVPGVVVVSTGAKGAPSSVFMRGANANQTLFVVDGVRLNTSNAAYGNFLGAADLAGLDRIEVLRGPQSTLYGSSAMGGVILLETAHGCGAASGSLSAFAGSFDSLGAGIVAQGGDANTGFSVALGNARTDNDRAYNRFKDTNYSTRVETQALPHLLVGGTWRGLMGHYEEPGSTLSPFPGDVQHVTNLVTTYAEAGAGERFKSKLTAAWYQDEYHWDEGDPFGYYSRNTRQIADWQNVWQAIPEVEVVAGVNAERSHYQAGGLTTDRSLAEYVSATAHPAKDVTLTAGLRHDDFDSAGQATTGRAGAAWLVNGGNTKLRATYGTGFNAPTPADRYGSPPYQLANPNVRPEKSRGWDAGIDQTLPGGKLQLGLTYFVNRFDDLLVYQIVDYATFAGEMINIGKATTRGTEVSLSGSLTAALTLRAAYTYLDAMDDVAHQRLIRRPRHSGDVNLDARLTPAWRVGAGFHVVADRLDGVYAPEPLPSYTTVRVYASYAVGSNWLIKARVENLLNRRYEEVTGYPALSRGAYASAEWKF